MKKAICLALISLAVSAVAETHITSNIEGINLDATGNPYFVEQDIIVPAGKTVTIKEGCVFLFKNFTGLRVDGKLTVEGSSARPVVFSSVNDGDQNPNAEQLPNSFDWNGIVVSRECTGAYFKNFQIKFSVYGIKSQNPNIQIENGIFSQNGQFNFTINEKVQAVTDNVPFSFNANGAGEPVQNKTIKSDGKPGGEKGTGEKEKPSLGKQVLRYSCLGVGIIGIGVGAFFAIKTGQSSQEMKKYDVSQGGIANNEKWTQAKNSYTGNSAGAIVSFSLGGLSLIGFGLTFAF
jgi:hypothetical protein